MSAAAINLTPDRLQQFQGALAMGVVRSERSTVGMVASITLEQFAAVMEKAEVIVASDDPREVGSATIRSAAELARRMALTLRTNPPAV